MVHNENQRRGLWKLGKVEKLVKGDDDKVRSAIVRVHGDGRKGNTLKRPINKLYPLEVRSEETPQTWTLKTHHETVLHSSRLTRKIRQDQGERLR